jgi:hypothetical protein
MFLICAIGVYPIAFSLAEEPASASTEARIVAEHPGFASASAEKQG